jgi:N-dimethylarginine dimethylaminohydrolase
MCPPEHFDVTYAINPWMRPDQPANAELAMRQWQSLRQTYLDLGHEVRLIEPVRGLPDMVFAANGATVVNGTVLGARFRYPQRAAEASAYLDWFKAEGWSTVVPEKINEGEGDILTVPSSDGGEVVLAGYGFRSDVAAAGELERVFGLPVVSLRLTDPRYYHLDTAMCVLDSRTAMYYPAAFDDEATSALASVFPELIEAKDEDAEVLGLNAVSDGNRVVIAAQATGLIGELANRGYEPVPVDMSELRKAGGGPKCCTLELRK